MRVLIAELKQETSSFNPRLTERELFELHQGGYNNAKPAAQFQDFLFHNSSGGFNSTYSAQYLS